MSFILLAVAGFAFQETVIEREVAPEKVVSKAGLGTTDYTPREKEKPFFEKLGEDERKTGSILGGDYRIQGKKGKYVSWFGIVRQVKSGREGHEVLLEHKYFDGLTDLHILALSFFGSGDFTATVRARELKLEPLVLVRAYGTVDEEKEGVPRLKVSYMRVFPWKTFTFLKCYGVDRRNEKWKKLCEVAEDRIYNPYPDDEYYLKRLGPRPSK